MRRSEINNLLKEAMTFFDRMKFKLPGFAYWTPAEWAHKGHEVDGIRNDQLGWDITDFGSEDFFKTGLLLFTVRNGNSSDPDNKKTYAEKIMIVRENQVTPYHFHWHKMEDIINRGGGNLIIKIYPAAADHTLGHGRVEVHLDGTTSAVDAGTEICLLPGESITLRPYQYHSFWAEAGHGLVLTGEVSQVNDDSNDNRFLQELPRFPMIEEDEKPFLYLVSEYPAAQTSTDSMK